MSRDVHLHESHTDVVVSPSQTGVVLTDGGSDAHYIAAGDQRPHVDATLLEAGEPYDLSDARQLRFHLLEQNGTLVFDNRADVVDDEVGHVRYEWGRGETDDAGLYKARFVAKYSAGETYSFPNRGAITVHIARR